MLHVHWPAHRALDVPAEPPDTILDCIAVRLLEGSHVRSRHPAAAG